jgi:hypothetical protein
MLLLINLFPALEHLYLPTAWLAQTDRDDVLTYLGPRASPVTCASYGVDLSAAHQTLLTHCERLAPKALEANFKPPKSKTATPLAELLDPKSPAKATVEAYIYRYLDLVLSEAVRLGVPLSLDAERKTLIKDVQILPMQAELVPHLSFTKTESGIEYRFRLGTDTEHWAISSREVIPLTNLNPAWIVADYALFRVPGINGNMVRPFRQKDVIQIPPDKVRVYFKQFIARSAGRGHIEADGFDVQVTQTLRSTRLELVEDILQKTWLIRPTFEYDGAEFAAGDTRNHVTAVDYPDGSDEVVVRKVSRNKATEQDRLTYLTTLGAEPQGRYFEPPMQAQGDISTLQNHLATAGLRWLGTHREALETEGFKVPLPQIEGRDVVLQEGDVRVQSALEGDWFDVRGQVQVGAKSFPFGALIPYLRKGDTFFPLGDGTFFMIPAAWFARFGELAGALKEVGEGALRLPKTLFMLLDASTQTPSEGHLADVEMSDRAPLIIDAENIDYAPGPDLKAELRPYQLSGVKWLIGHMQHGFGACLADDMGLGKTLQTIAALLHAKNTRTTGDMAGGGAQMNLFQTYQEEIRPLQALVVLPSSLVFNWQRELERFAPSLFVRVHTGARREKDARVLGSHDVVLTTYHTARQDLELLCKIGWHAVVLDESQWIKNRGSELSKMVRALPATHKISLSGTPIENSLADLWSQMEFINPATLGTFAQFKEQFQMPIERHQDMGARERLFARVRPYFLRRTKEEVAPDLPPLTEQVFWCEMSNDQRHAYDSLKSAVMTRVHVCKPS